MQFAALQLTRLYRFTIAGGNAQNVRGKEKRAGMPSR
jgi:hypothetical protein